MMTNKSIKVITFDLDDTLWSVGPVIIKADQQVYEWLKQYAPAVTERYSQQQLAELRYNYYQQRPELAHQISKIRMVAMQDCLLQVGYSTNESKQLSEQAFKVFIDARHQVKLFDSVRPTLEILHQEFSLGVLTNGNADIYQLSIGNYFDFAFSAEQLNASKPAANHFLAAQEFCGCEANEIIHVGDHIHHDIDAAIQSGCHAIWFNPKGLKNTENVNISWQVQSLSELPATISKIQNLPKQAL
jgi:putative hydrolase of the HAD superfamily